MDFSGLEDEFELSRGLPRLLYFKAPAPGREPRLASLIFRIEELASDSYRTFGTATELGRLVRDDLAALISERFAGTRPLTGAAVHGRGAAAGQHAGLPRSAGCTLPADTSAFTGRSQQLQEITATAASAAQAGRAVAIHAIDGMPGVGKTTLATTAPPAATSASLWSAACKWAFPGRAAGETIGSDISIRCLGPNGQVLGGFDDGSGHSLSDWCDDPSHTAGISLPDPMTNDSGSWTCTPSR